MKPIQFTKILIKGLLIFTSLSLLIVNYRPGSAQKQLLVTSYHPKFSKNEDTSAYKIYIPAITKSCNCYYVDNNTGSDSNSGTQPEKPWKTISKLNRANLQPGITVYLKRGSVWDESLNINASGKPGQPITITAYGSGNMPVLTNQGDTDNNESIVNLYGSNIVINNLNIKDSGRGINIFSNNNIIQNSEISDTGIGIVVKGQYNLITHNKIHDTRMIVNTNNGGTDDWGANGIDINNSHNEISYNEFVNCEAPSYDFGTGGGAVEIFKQGDYISVHHNRSLNSAGFMEVSGDGTGSANNVTIFYNTVINSTRFTYIHLSGGYSMDVHNFRVENNTLVDLRPHETWIGNFIGFSGSPLPDTYFLTNNIIYLSDYWWVSEHPITHRYNTIYLLNGRKPFNSSLGTGELIADPQFVDIANYDFHLRSTSPARNAGINLGYNSDFDLNRVPINNIPDTGAYEYQGN